MHNDIYPPCRVGFHQGRRFVDPDILRTQTTLLSKKALKKKWRKITKGRKKEKEACAGGKGRGRDESEEE